MNRFIRDNKTKRKGKSRVLETGAIIMITIKRRLKKRSAKERRVRKRRVEEISIIIMRVKEAE